jgi:hypothetical protein
MIKKSRGISLAFAPARSRRQLATLNPEESIRRRFVQMMKKQWQCF